MPPLQRLVVSALRISIVGACCYGIWSSLTLARAGYLFKQDTEQSVRAAVGLVPDGWEYCMRLSELDQAHARELLSESLRLNRYNSQADIELGLQYEADGDFPDAEKLLLEAYDVDHTYTPRWSLANYYLRRDNMPEFWAWARSAAAMPNEDIGSLFELCWRVTSNPDAINRAILNEKPEMIRQYIGFLLGKNQPAAVAAVAAQLVRWGDPATDRPLLLDIVDNQVDLNEGAAAARLWHLLVERHWVNADSTVPNNAGFRREPLPVSFDWLLQDYQGLHSWPGASGLESEFGGTQPEDCIIAQQAVVLRPGNYAMSYSYHTSDISPASGIHWQIVDAKTGTVLAESPDLSSDALLSSGFGFSVSTAAPLLQLRLVYRRALGTARISGMLDVVSTQIQAIPKT
jgi:hypothetical protein